MYLEPIPHRNLHKFVFTELSFKEFDFAQGQCNKPQDVESM